MKKMSPVAIVVIVFVVATVIGLVYAKIKSTPKSPDTMKKNASQEANTTPSQTFTLFEDPAGFTFEYPQGLVLNKHEEDTENYAHNELTDANHPGNVTVWAKDTTAKDVDAWVKGEKRFTGAIVLDTTLGGYAAKKIMITTPKKMLVTGTIFDGLLFTVEATLEDSPYWTSIHDTVTGKFSFKPLPAEEESSGDEAPSDAVDEEEVVE